MNRIILTIIFFIATTIAASQEKVLSEAEFNDVWKNACEKTKNAPHLFTETLEEYYEETRPPYHSYISLKRYIPPDRVWTVAGTKDTKVEDRYQEIRIGRTSYSRDGNGEWKIKELGFSGLYDYELPTSRSIGGGNGSGSGNSDGNVTIKTENEYKYLGKQKVGEKSADLYVHTTKTTFSSAKFDSQSTTKMSYWLSGDGMYLRKESIKRTAGTQRWSRQLSEYVYDTKELKIEAPIK